MRTDTLQSTDAAAIPLVIIESPFAGKTQEEQNANIEYAQRCLHDSLMRGEAPIAFHLLYTQPNVLDDSIPEQRSLGLKHSFAWYDKALFVAVYCDRGISPGMIKGMQHASKLGKLLSFRYIEPTYA